MPRASLLILLFSLVAPSSLLAAQLSEIALKNGDKLTGEIVSQDANELVLKTALFGTLHVPRSQVASTQPSKAPVAPAPGGTAVGLGNEGRNAPAWKQVLHDTKGTMEVGFDQQSGRTESVNATVRANANYHTATDHYAADFTYFYGRYNGSVQSDRHESNFQWRHDLKAKRLFFQSTTDYMVDHVKLINVNLEQTAGLGVTAMQNDKQTLNLGSGLTGQYRRAYGLDNGVLALANAFEDYAFKFNDRIDLKQTASLQYSPVGRQSFVLVNGQQVPTNDQATNYSLRFNVALQSKLTHRISLNLHYDLEYDNAIFDPNLKTDQRVSSTIGYTF